MLLSKVDRKLFFKLYIPLLGFANKYDGLNKKRDLGAAREILYGNRQIILDYVKQNPDKLTPEDLAIVSGWVKFIKGRFVAIGDEKDKTVLLFLGGRDPKCYGALGLTEEIMNFMEYGIGTMFSGTLLPWRNKIIWDGLCAVQPVILGRNYMRSFKEDYQRLKKQNKIINSLK